MNHPELTESSFDYKPLEWLPSERVVFDESCIKIGDQEFTYNEILQKSTREALLASFVTNTPEDPLSKQSITGKFPEYTPSNEVVFDKDEVKVGNQSFTYNEMLQTANKEALLPSFDPNKSAPSPVSKNSDSYEKLVDSSFPKRKKLFELPRVQKSIYFHTEGIRKSNCRIGGINGINTLLQDALLHAYYLKKFTEDYSIDWVYNQSHDPVMDVAEVLAFNYAGYSPYTAKLLRNNWTEFHKENINNPKVKYLQICHSQGTVHVRNALTGASQEIRDRVIVVAIAPAAIISEDICYRSFNYASRKDPIPKIEFNLMYNSSLKLEYEDRVLVQKMIQDR